MLSSKAAEPLRLKRSGDIFAKESAELHFQLRASSGLQPRGRKYPELIPEFSEVVLRSFTSSCLPQPLVCGNKLTQSQALFLEAPVAAKILNINLGEKGDERVDVSLGVYHTPPSSSRRLCH